MLMDRNTRYRYLAFADGAEPRDVEAEHQAIIGAVLARDADRAVEAANAHLVRPWTASSPEKANFRVLPRKEVNPYSSGEHPPCLVARAQPP